MSTFLKEKEKKQEINKLLNNKESPDVLIKSNGKLKGTRRQMQKLSCIYNSQIEKRSNSLGIFYLSYS